MNKLLSVFPIVWILVSCKDMNGRVVNDRWNYEVAGYIHQKDGGVFSAAIVGKAESKGAAWRKAHEAFSAQILEGCQFKVAYKTVWEDGLPKPDVSTATGSVKAPG